MERCCEEALRQIETQEYEKNLPGYRQILCYGIAFHQKSALVEKGHPA